MNPLHNIHRFIILMFLLCTIHLNAQNKYRSNKKLGAGIETFGSANGHGQFHSAYMSVHKNWHAFHFGVMMQKRNSQFGGFKITYSQNLTGRRNTFLKDDFSYHYNYPDLIQVNFFSSLQVNRKLPLGYSALQKEKTVNTEGYPDLSQLKLATAEASAGLAIQANITNVFCLNVYMGASYYHHLNYPYNLLHQRSGLSCYLGTSLSFIIP